MFTRICRVPARCRLPVFFPAAGSEQVDVKAPVHELCLDRLRAEAVRQVQRPGLVGRQDKREDVRVPAKNKNTRDVKKNCVFSVLQLAVFAMPKA